MSAPLAGLVRRTPLLALSDAPHLCCKLEAMQTSGSFKIRGTVAMLRALAADGDDRQVITVSMGNTAFSLAWAGRLLNRRVTVVMPTTVAPDKLALTRAIGAEVILHGDTGSAALAHCEALVTTRDCLFLHPHKSPAFLAGSEGIADEILTDDPPCRRLYVPVGGGGLLSAICNAVARSGRAIEVIGVEAAGAPAFARSLAAGQPVDIGDPDTIADALTINAPDPEVFAHVAPRIAGVVTVTDAQIISAMRRIFDEFRVIAEPGGAATLAAMLAGDDGTQSAAIISGGNVSLERFGRLTGQAPE